ncbi:hypothetical protein H2O73_01660 [Vibrio sp. 404]|uniref:Uncharacterized protein n=1 Tax=Vibrio marinisediminis TaxID=2758441 RepID=A0A7W2ISF4_9VIBR|nr:hypothetical protein [Vibrio marinisediminis]MBA5761033.1 hypothetical protein [Vibrio marinisediminis]
MYKLVCGISALVIGLLIFGSYDLVFSNQWYISHSSELLLAILSELPSFREYLTSAGFIDVTQLISLLQSITLSIVFAIIFRLILNTFTGLISVVQYVILGAFCGFLYYALPALIVFVDSQFFANTLSLPSLAPNGIVDVLIWYLPLMITVFFTAMSRRRHFAQAERFWFK